MSMTTQEVLETALLRAIEHGYEDGKIVLDYVTRDWDDGCQHYEPIIFNLEFARYLWGDERDVHLQRMVIYTDRIAYLEANID